jgi:hypothetical protein
MAADLLATEVNVVRPLQNNVELANLVWRLPAAEELQHAHLCCCHIST